MKLVIAHLYYDLLNLYGESGNIKALKKYLEEQDIEVVIEKVTVNEQLNFSKYNMIYIGSGTENNQKIVLKHLIKYKDEIKKYIESDKFILVTGNSVELFGKYIMDKYEKKHKALGVFDYYTLENNKRLVCESIVNTESLSDKIIGFQNRGSVIKNISSTWFSVETGYGNDIDSKEEGVKYKNFYGTYLIGPILVRNPHFLKNFGDSIILKKKKNYSLKNVDFTLQQSAYENSLKKYLEKSK